MKGDIEWYKNMWSTRQNHQCEECGVRLLHFHPIFVSHIITKGSYPTLRQHPENWMLYCMDCHQLWEFGNRKTMKTYPRAMEIAERLKREYHESKKK